MHTGVDTGSDGWSLETARGSRAGPTSCTCVLLPPGRWWPRASVSTPGPRPGGGSRPVPQGRDLEQWGGPQTGEGPGDEHLPTGHRHPLSCRPSHGGGAGPGRGSPVQREPGIWHARCPATQSGWGGCAECHPHRHCRGPLRSRGPLGLSLRPPLTKPCKDWSWRGGLAWSGQCGPRARPHWPVA